MSDSSLPPYLDAPEPDVIVMRSNSGTNLEELSQALAERAKQGRFYMVIDFTQFSAKVDADMRERGPKLIKPEWLAGVVYVNASTPIRVALKVFKLAMLLSSRPLPSEHASSMEEALQIIAGLREKAAE